MIRFLQSGNKAAKYLLGGMMGILALSMVAYLIPGFMSGTTITDTRVVARVGRQEISAQDVQRFVGRIQQQQRQRGQAYPEAFLPYLRQQAIQSLIQQEEFRYEADRMGLGASDEEVRQELRDGPLAPTFFPEGKWIGQQQYEDMLRSNGYTVDEFERQIRFDLIRNKLLAAVTAGVTVAPPEVERMYKDQNLKIKFDYAIINADEVKKAINPTESELKAYYEAHKASYQNSIPEKRQVRYFVLNDKQAQGKLTITPTEVDQYYRSHEEQYRVPDRVKARHILIKAPGPGPDGKVDQKAVDAARANAADILKQVKAGGDFAELAQKNSDDPGSKDKGGELGWFEKGQMVPAFESAAFSMNKGQISDLVQTDYGFHIIQTEDKEVAHKKSLTEVKDSIEQTLKEQKTADLLQQMSTAAEAEARSHGIDKAAAKYGAAVIETGPITRGSALAGVGSSGELMNDIFNAKPKAPPQSERTQQGNVIFEVTKIIPPSTPTFEDIKERVTNEFKSERVNALVTQKTTELADRAHAEHDLHKAAKELGATIKTSALLTRSAQVPEIGSMSGSASKAFELKQGEISGPLSTGQNGAVVAIIDRQEASLTGDDFAKAKDNLREQLLQGKRQEAMQLFLSNLDVRLKKEGKVKINENALGKAGRNST
jgi:peptidyl-prolyl cis-trans isomerase D